MGIRLSTSLLLELKMEAKDDSLTENALGRVGLKLRANVDM